MSWRIFGGREVGYQADRGELESLLLDHWEDCYGITVKVSADHTRVPVGVDTIAIG